MTDIQARLFSLRDVDYAAFQAKLLPNIDAAQIIGIRTPVMRKLARELYGSDLAAAFLQTLPHVFFDENQLHAFLLSLEKDFDRCLAGVNAFLPYVDNWATCDQLLPKAFKKTPERLLPEVERWLQSDHVYTIRFAIGMLMQHFLDARFSPEYLSKVAAVRHEDYYVRMMCAWYFATALAKQYDAALPYLTEQLLDRWVHNKTIQKAVESYRITDEQKAFLKTLRRK